MEIAEIQPQLVQEFSKILSSKKLSHAYLFSGGFGNFELAIWLSQAIFCETPGVLPCLKCRACRFIAKGEYADLHLISPDGMMIKTAQIKALTEVFSESGYESNRKVIIIQEADKMHPNAANALLKSIEEPERDSYIFLLTQNENLILPTILSRTQVIKFPKQTPYFKSVLEQNGILPTQAELLCQLTDSIDDAIKMAQTSWFSEGLNKCFQFVKLMKSDPDDAFLYLSALTETFDDKARQQVLFDLLIQLFYQEKWTKKIEKTFEATTMWQHNVRFESCLNYIVLESEKD